MKKKKLVQWIILIDGEPVGSTNAYTRNEAIHSFCDIKMWKEFVASGYTVKRFTLTQTD